MNSSANLLREIAEFHRQVIAIADTGMPIAYGLTPGQALPIALDRFLARIALQLSRGESIDSILTHDAELPKPYRDGLRDWVEQPQSPAALETLYLTGHGRHEMMRSFIGLYWMPLLIAALCYLGILFQCYFTLPSLNSLQAQLQTEPGRWLKLLQAINHWLPIWAPLIPIALLLVYYRLQVQARRRERAWLPGRTQFVTNLEKVHIVESVMQSTRDGKSLELCLEQAAELSRIAGHMQVQDLSQSMPLLHWSLKNNQTPDDRLAALQFAKDIYSHNARKVGSFWRVPLPMLVTGICGGLMVLAYGVSLFAPVSELMYQISRPVWR